LGGGRERSAKKNRKGDRKAVNGGAQKRNPTTDLCQGGAHDTKRELKEDGSLLGLRGSKKREIGKSRRKSGGIFGHWMRGGTGG